MPPLVREHRLYQADWLLRFYGYKAESLLDEINITCNKNSIPFDPQKPVYCSGIRLGSAAMTTRGFKEDDMREVARIIADAIKNSDNENILAKLRLDSLKLCEKYPLY